MPPSRHTAGPGNDRRYPARPTDPGAAARRTPARRASSARGGKASPLRLALIAGALLLIVVAALRLVPGSPFSASAARWGTQAAPVPSTTSPAASRKATPTSAAPSLPPLAIRPTTVKIDATGWWAWAMIDHRTGEIYGSKNMTETSTTASLIKAWIAADFLRRSAEQQQTPSAARMTQLTKMIRDSDNDAAEDLFEAVGRISSIERLMSMCKLTDSSPSSAGGWSRTRLSPRDIARMGKCIDDGRAAGPKWTDWLLKEMRLVRGVGDFGIRSAFPESVQDTIAIKNGWIDRTAEQEYHVSCLAIGDGWSVGVMTRYPINRGYTYGAEICESVGRQLRNVA